MRDNILDIEIVNKTIAGVRTKSCVIPTTRLIDASGRASRMPGLLKAKGLSEIQITTMDPKVVYVSGLVRLTEEPDSRLVFVTASAHNPSAGMLAKIENGRWMVTLVGIAGQSPPSEPAEFIKYAKGLRTPRIHHLLQQAELASELTVFGNTANRWRHYEQMPDLPKGLLVMGDAAIALNPLYGHGMTATAEQALVLQQSSGDFGLEVQKKLVKAVQPIWVTTLLRDRSFVRGDEQPVARKKRKAGLLQKFISKLAAGASHSSVLRDAVLGLSHLTHRPLSLLRPQILWAVWKERAR